MYPSVLQQSSGSSSSRDRTNEFMSAIRTLQGQRNPQGGFNQQSPMSQDRHGQLGKLASYHNYMMSRYNRTIKIIRRNSAPSHYRLPIVLSTLQQGDPENL